MLILIDSDSRRRASVSHALSPFNIHVEPFENIDELAGCWPRSGVILKYDSPGEIPDLIVRMARSGEWFPIIAFHEAPSTAQIVQAILDGATDYMTWPFATDELMAGLARANSHASAPGNRRLREALARSRIEELTGRERQVLMCVAEGLSNRRIGEKLSMSSRTVELHRAKMLCKLGANDTAEAIRIAIEADLSM